MDARLSKESEDFLDAHSSLSQADVEARAEEAARRNEELIAAEMRELAEHPLDLTDVPHAEEVLAALPEDLHPLVFRDFWTLPRDHFVMDGRPVSVREWLLRGGDPGAALRYAESYFVLG